VIEARDDFQLGKLVRLVAGIAVIVILIQFVLDDGPAELLRQLAGVSAAGWLVLLVLSLVVLAALSSVFQAMISVVGVQLPFVAAFDYSAMNTFFNTVLPMKGGVVVRGLYLKQRYGVTWGSYLFVLATGQLFQLGLLATIAIVIFLAGRVPLHIPDLPVDTIAIALLVALAVAALATWLRRELVVEYTHKVARGLSLWIEDLPRLLRFVAATLAFHGLSALRLWLSFSLVGHTLSLTEICVLYAALAAGLSWAVTPGNLGVKEAAIVLLALILGIDKETALAASIVDRIASLTITLSIGGLSAYRVSSDTAAR
jgi:uncharacterized protein (TIRG00374 family)